MHEHVFTLEERARLSDEEAVRRRFDARNLRVLRWACWPIAAVAVGLLVWGLAAGGPIRAALAAAALATALLCGLVLNRVLAGGDPYARLEPLARVVGDSARGFTLVLLATEYILLWGVSFGTRPGAEMLSILFAWFAVAFRLLASETVLLSVGIAAFFALEAALTGGFTEDTLGGVIPNLAVALALALWLSRRARIEFLRGWRTSRADAVEQMRIRDEVGFARELQLSMLPRGTPPLPWIEASAISLPATEVGGDYYDYLVLDADRLVIVTGDVAGHGIASGIVLSGVRSGLALLADELSDPSAVMRRLHRMVRQTLRHRMLVSLSILLLDRSSGVARLTAAAHPPLFVRRSSGTVERIDTSSLPLGNGLGDTFDQREIPFASGDAFVLQTDGVYETTSPAGESFGFSRIENALAAADGSAGTVRDALLRDLWTFKGSAAQADDVTIVVVKIV